MWTYSQKSGAITNPNGDIIAHGYSGHGEGLNNPLLQNVQGVGPPPRGMWKMVDMRPDTENHGPLVIVLKPIFKTKRSGFLMHGDNSKGDQSASLGCIIAPKPIRQTIWNSGDRDLLVVE